jgi:hypothetical protein
MEIKMQNKRKSLKLKEDIELASDSVLEWLTDATDNEVLEELETCEDTIEYAINYE